MKEKVEDQELIKALRSLPDVIDETEKEHLYNRITNKMNDKEPKRNHKKNMMPIFSIAAVFVIMLIIIPIIINQDEFFTADDKSLNQASYEMSDKQSVDSEYGSESQNDSADYGEKEELESRVMNAPTESYIAQTINENELVIHAGLSDMQAQYVIPLSFIVENEDELSLYYDQLATYLEEDEWGLSDYPFEGTSFDLNIEEHEVKVTLPHDFKIGDGSASPYIFERILTTMFIPHGIEKVVFQTNSIEGVNLGPFGVVKEMALFDNGQASYKIYQLENNKRQFLIPIPHQEEKDITEAFAEMKVSEEDFNVFHSIPERLSFEVEPNNKELIIRFTDGALLENDQEYNTMIEAMLMTAKVYGYDHIQFENTIVDQIGLYDLQQPISIPEAINPIYIMNQ